MELLIRIISKSNFYITKRIFVITYRQYNIIQYLNYFKVYILIKNTIAISYSVMIIF